MAGTSEKITGHLKEAAGDLTGDRDLEREGKADRATGEVKDKAEQVKDKVGDAADKVKDKVKDVIHRD